MSHSRTHLTTLARSLNATTGMGYQRALETVRTAAAAGSLPAQLDEAGMTSALEALTDLVTSATSPPATGSISSGSERSVLVDTGAGLDRHPEPGPHSHLNAELRRRGIDMPQVVDYRPDGVYRVWRDGHVVLTVNEVESRWTAQAYNDTEGLVAAECLTGATAGQAAAAMAVTAQGLPLRPSSFQRFYQDHLCDSDCVMFQFFAGAWCVTHAWELIDTDPFAARFVDDMIISDLDGMIGLPEPEPGYGRMVMLPIDTDRAASADLSIPLLGITVRDEQASSDFVIDLAGWERVYRARTEGLSALPAYLLSEDVERAIRRAPDSRFAVTGGAGHP
jgi:hypothetical protein